MTLLKPMLVWSDRFTVVFEKGSRVLVSDASDLGGPLQRVWDDSCDVGLTIVSRRTGREIVFCVENEKRDDEGELLWIDLAPANRRERSEFSNLIVRLFND